MRYTFRQSLYSSNLVQIHETSFYFQWLTAVYQIHVNTVEPVERKKEDLFALAQLSTGELSAMVNIQISLYEIIHKIPIRIFQSFTLFLYKEDTIQKRRLSYLFSRLIKEFSATLMAKTRGPSAFPIHSQFVFVKAFSHSFPLERLY